MSDRENGSSGVDDDTDAKAHNKFNAMLEQQRIADVFRAQSKLISMKNFRVSNEKMYKDKELQEIRKKEIYQPLEEAHTIIEVLEGKIARRDMMIKRLQKYISVDLLKGQQSVEDVRNRVVDINQTEEQNQLVLMDTITELQKVIESQAARMVHCKDTIQHQREKIKAFTREFEMQEFNHKEHARQLENDKEVYVRLAEAKENKLQDLYHVRQTLEGRVETLSHEVKDTLRKFRESQSLVRTLQEEAKQAQVDLQELQARYSATEFSLLETKEHLEELKERHANLRTRYEGLVAELDEMVEAGCSIPPAGASRKDIATGAGAGANNSNKRLLTKAGKSGKGGSTKSHPGKGGSLYGGSGSVDDGGGSVDNLESTSLHGDDNTGNSHSNKDRRDYSNPEGNRFEQRMRREDQENELQLAENRAARQGDVLGKEVAQLRQTIAQMQLELGEALKRASSGQGELESQQAALKSEVSKLASKNQELSSRNYKLIHELQDKDGRLRALEEAKIELLEELENLRDSHSCKEQALSSLQEQFTELHSRLNTPHPTIVAYDDELATPTGGNGHVEDTDFGLPPDYDPAFNINDFISAPPVDVGTQKGASEFYDMATQLPYPYDPDWQPAHQSVQTSAADVLYPMEHYLETLFRDFATESQNYIPEGNLAILRSSRPQDSAKEPTSRLGGKDAVELPPLLEEAATFRVKRGLVYLSALNDLRNRHIHYINRVGAWNTINARMVVRCLDLVLQTTHNILCPADMVEDSGYEELRQAVDAGDEGYYSEVVEEDSQVYGELSAITAKWKKSSKSVMKRHSTFKLTETELAAEHNYGAPKGLLNTEPGQVLTKAIVKYMNRSVRRRQTVQDVDSLLEQTEGRGTPRTPSSPLDRSPVSHRVSAPPSRGEALRSANSNRSNSISPRGGLVSADGASPLVKAFAAKALAIAAIAMHSAPSSPETVPVQPDPTSRKLSAFLPSPAELSQESQESLEACSGPGPGPWPGSLMKPKMSSESFRTVRAVQGYYNFGSEMRVADVSATATALSPAREGEGGGVSTSDGQNREHGEGGSSSGGGGGGTEILTVEAALLGAVDAVNMKIKIKQDLPVAASFEFTDKAGSESNKEEEEKRVRKQSRSPKRVSVGFIPQPALSENSEDYVDYTRIPFDVNSAENKIRTKKMSVSGTVLSMSPAPTSRKASTGNQQVIAAHLPSVAAAADPVEKTAAASAIYDDTTTGPAIAVEGHKNDRSDIDGVNLQTYINQMTTEGEPGVDLGTGQGVRPANEAYQHQHQEAPRPTSSTNRVPFPRIGSAAGSVGAGSNGGSRPASSTAGGGGGGGGFGSSNRNDARTPTLADHAARLQLTTPLPPPQPLYVAEQQSHKAHNTAGVLSSAGLKNLLQKNIEASAMAVYQLQEQQQQIKGKARGQGDAGLTDSNALVVTASCASAAHPPTRLRPSSTKARSTRQQQQQQQSPRQQHKAKDIDWSNPNYVPSGAIGSATMPAGSIDSSLASVASSQANHTWTSDSSQPALQQRGTSSRGQISQDGNFDVYAAFQSGKSAFNDSAVVRLASPTHTAAGGNALGSPIGGVNASNKFSDMVVSGRKRSAEASREKVTNAVLFM